MLCNSKTSIYCNQCEKNGGAIYLDRGEINATNTMFYNNSVNAIDGEGGSIGVYLGRATLSNSIFLDNKGNKVSIFFCKLRKSLLDFRFSPLLLFDDQYRALTYTSKTTRLHRLLDR